jgi:hypothetical protein
MEKKRRGCGPNYPWFNNNQFKNSCKVLPFSRDRSDSFLLQKDTKNDESFKIKLEYIIKLIVTKLSIIEDIWDKIIYEALNLYDKILENGFTLSNSGTMNNTGLLAIGLIFYALVKQKIEKIGNNLVSAKFIFNSIGNDLKKVGLSANSYKRINLKKIKEFLPDYIKIKMGKIPFERKPKVTYNDCKTLAEKKGGKVITSESNFNYKKSKYKIGASKIPIEWRCTNQEHESWITPYNSIKAGTWCPECAGNHIPKTYNDCRKMAEEKGGNLLTSKEEFEILIKNNSPSRVFLNWKCANQEHELWKASFSRIQQGSWCPDCAGIKPKTYEYCQALAHNRGMQKNGIPGKLLTTKSEFEKLTITQYPSAIALEWCCNIQEHKSWYTSYQSIKRGHWCPSCAQGLYEQICRWYFEKILSYIYKCNMNFPKEKLRNIIKIYDESKYSQKERIVIENLLKRGHLDGYCSNLRLAFEYNGPQHSRYPNHVHKSFEQFNYYLLVDKIKRKLCEENKIIVIDFPFDIDEKMNKNEIIQSFIINQLQKKTEIRIPRDIPQYNHFSPEFGQDRLDKYF